MQTTGNLNQRVDQIPIFAAHIQERRDLSFQFIEGLEQELVCDPVAEKTLPSTCENTVTFSFLR
jgi:hypothetical protein